MIQLGLDYDIHKLGVLMTGMVQANYDIHKLGVLMTGMVQAWHRLNTNIVGKDTGLPQANIFSQACSFPSRHVAFLLGMLQACEI